MDGSRVVEVKAMFGGTVIGNASGRRLPEPTPTQEKRRKKRTKTQQ